MKNKKFIDLIGRMFLAGSDEDREVLQHYHFLKESNHIVATDKHILMYAPASRFRWPIQPRDGYVDISSLVGEPGYPILQVSAKDIIYEYGLMDKESFVKSCTQCEDMGCDNCDYTGATEFLGFSVNRETYCFLIRDVPFDPELVHKLAQFARYLEVDAINFHYLEPGKGAVITIDGIYFRMMPILQEAQKDIRYKHPLITKPIL